MQPIPTVQWLVRSFLGAVLLLFACGLASAWFGNGPQMTSITASDDTLNNFNRYSRETAPDVVLVGSSLTFRLREEYFDTPKLRNLAIAGGSPVTALEIILKQPRLPKLVLVETNILNRPIDAALVERFSEAAAPDPLFVRPVQAAVAAYEQWRHAPPSRKEAALALARLFKQPPSDFDNRAFAERTLELWNAEEPTAATLANVKRIEQLIAMIEERGARVLLYDMPYSEPIEGSQYAKITYKIVHDKFRDANRWLRFDFMKSELRWSDGAHLDKRSAGLVAQAIDRALSSLIGPT
jgi:hypothetical protein